MKQIFTLLFTIVAFSISFGQYNVPLTNADVESSTPMTTSDNVKYTIDGMFVQEAVAGSFDEASSGLAPGAGVGGSQALKIVTETTGSTASWHTQFAVNQTDISGYGSSDFVFSFQIKSATTPASYPIWIVLRTFDANGTEVTSNTVTNYSAGGKISAAVGDPTNTWNNMATAYQTAWNTFSIVPNSGGGNNAKFVDLRVQMSKFVNTYYIDNVSLTSSAALGINEFKSNGLSMYPNPASHYSTIKSETPIKNIEIYSLTGKMVFDKTINNREYNLDVSTYSKGLYFLHVMNDKGRSTTKLIVD